MEKKTSLFSFGLGIGTKNRKGEWLEVFFSTPVVQVDEGLVTLIGKALEYEGGNEVVNMNSHSLNALIRALENQPKEPAVSIYHLARQLKSSNQPIVAVLLETDSEPQTVPEVYLKLQLLSHRLVKPHEINLTGMFGSLPNVAWTSEGVVDLEELPQKQLEARMKGKILEVHSVDKFPQMTNYHVPAGVRIGDANRIRLGAYLGEGTTVMHEGFVNFNAGTEGPNMVEGRISAGVFVCAHSDLGGGCSTMGTLSGGNDVIISVGKECLLGANAGLGIPLGDRCTIEAGLYLTGSSKVSVLDKDGKQVKIVKAGALANEPDLLFRRNSQTGAIECMTNKSAIALNEELHSNN
jgi:2,3,4,5-tetrahydropyridine-2-carboxylate N-succinyltransferase